MTRSKVPEVVLTFWIIKILCTSVGESFAECGFQSPQQGVAGWRAPWLEP